MEDTAAAAPPEKLGAGATGNAAPPPAPRRLDAAYLADTKPPPGTLGSVWNQAFLVTVSNEKGVGYTYEVNLEFKGEWSIKEEIKKVKGYLDIPEFSFGELEDLDVQIRFSDDNDLPSNDRTQICKDLKSFLALIREKP